MEPALYQRFYEIEERYWWCRWIRDLVRDWLPPGPSTRRILDLGCGTGMLSRELANAGRVTSLDYVPTAFPYCRQRGLTCLVRADGQVLPFPDGAFDVVLALDSLEHLRDDRQALGEVRRVLQPGGRLIMNVPALQLLWSSHDVANRHFRRYTSGQVRGLLADAGFAVDKLTYTNFVLFAPALAVRLSERLRTRRATAAEGDTIPNVPPALNSLLYGLLAGERRLVRHMNLPVGTSVFAVARAG